jgi:hypothetical protein
MTNLATWFTPMLKVISRAKEHSATAASAYRECTRLVDERTGQVHDYRKKKGHVSTLLFGANNASKLWNDAEKAENRINSTVARELILLLSHEWTDGQRLAFSKDVCKFLQLEYSVAVQCSIHRPSQGRNAHAHILFTTRTVDIDGNFGKKTRILDDLKTGEVVRLREKICEIKNEHAKKNGNNWFVYAGKYSAIDADHIPTVHVPHNTSAERKAELKSQNIEILDIRHKIDALRDEKTELNKKLKAEIQLEMKAEKLAALAIAASVDVSSMMPRPEPRKATPLARALELQKNAEVMKKYREIFETNETHKREWIRRLKVSQADSDFMEPMVVLVQSVLEKMGIKTNGIERLKKIEYSKSQIATAERNAEKLLKVLNHSARVADLAEWNRNPNYRAIIEASREPTPDEMRARERAQKDAYKPSPEALAVTVEQTPWDTPWSYPAPKNPWDGSPF